MKKHKGIKAGVLAILSSLILMQGLNVQAIEEQTVTSEQMVQVAQTPRQVIIDTDFSTDVDDALAVSTALYYQDAGVINIRGIALCCSSARGAYAMSALTTSHGYSTIPIACDWDDGIAMGSKYHVNMANRAHNEVYFNDTVNFYRMMLASSLDKVDIIVLGQIININDLLNSQPDIHSPLNGYELVREKVGTIYFVGGKSNGKLENNIFYGGEKYGVNKYYGNTKVAEAAKKVADTAPCRIMWLEADKVGTFEVGSFFAKSDRACSDIITKALNDYGKPNGSASFDPFGVWIACQDIQGKLDESFIGLEQGRMRINLNGTSTFTPNDLTVNHVRIHKLVNDGWYRSQIDNTLAFEFIKRTGKEVK